MPKYNPKTHVSDYGGTTPRDRRAKARRERHTLEEFCKRLGHNYRATYRIVRMRDALGRGLVLCLGGDTVDGVLRTPQGYVAVELLRYRPLDDRGDVMTRDFALRKRVKSALYALLRSKKYSVSFGYHEERRPGPKFALVKAVPKERDFKVIVKELRRVITDEPPLTFNTFLTLRFVKPDQVAKLGRQRGTHYLDATRFPACAAHFRRIRLQGYKNLTPCIDSDLNFGMLGLDAEFVREHVSDKARKSLNMSHKRANGLPLWLIVHCDGRPIPQTIHETHRPRAVELCRETLAVTPHGFARAYWADRTGYLNAAWVGRVL